MNVPQIRLNDGYPIPQVGLGTFLMDPQHAFASTVHALEIGYRHVDTAAIYRNEEAVGHAIRSSGVPRSELFVTTKLWNDRHLDAPAALQESLTRLGLDYVDLYLIHWPTPARNDYVPAWESLITLRERGLTRSIGVSNFLLEHLERIIAATNVTPTVNQIEVHPTFQQRALVAANEERGIKTQAWSPLGRGTELEMPEIVAIAEAVHRSTAQVILRWHIQKGYIVFPKSNDLRRIEANIALFDFDLTAEQMAVLDGLEEGNRVGPNPAELN